jgi:hypothetical protein
VKGVVVHCPIVTSPEQEARAFKEAEQLFEKQWPGLPYFRNTYPRYDHFGRHIIGTNIEVAEDTGSGSGTELRMGNLVAQD